MVHQIINWTTVHTACNSCYTIFRAICIIIRFSLRKSNENPGEELRNVSRKTGRQYCYRAWIDVSAPNCALEAIVESGISNLKAEDESWRWWVGFEDDSLFSIATTARSSWTTVFMFGRCLPLGSTLCMAKSTTFHIASKSYWPARSGSTISSIVPLSK
jgi:hypothetical protein